jgi:hypothetical protein
VQSATPDGRNGALLDGAAAGPANLGGFQRAAVRRVIEQGKAFARGPGMLRKQSKQAVADIGAAGFAEHSRLSIIDPSEFGETHWQDRQDQAEMRVR